MCLYVRECVGGFLRVSNLQADDHWRLYSQFHYPIDAYLFLQLPVIIENLKTFSFKQVIFDNMLVSTTYDASQMIKMVDSYQN